MDNSKSTEGNGQYTTPKQKLKALGKASGLPQKDLIVLAPANDPFNSGTPTDVLMAEWFADIYRRFGFQRGVYLRRIHYRISSGNEKIYRPDGQLYENTIPAWKYLQDASKHARYIGLVDAQDFVDHRNPDPKVFAADPNEPDDPYWVADDFCGLSLPKINSQLGVHLGTPDISVGGYEYDDGDQPYHLEVWVEKNTMNDVLEPVCQKYKANFCPSLGFQSVTAVIQLLARVRRSLELGRSVRIFYISDFDPAGDSMPVAVGRQLQFWMEAHGLSGDIKLRPLVLTRSQVEQYDLPRKPIEETDRRKGRFEERHGEGAVELDALEAIHPGELARIVEAAMEPYRDVGLEQRMSEAEYAANWSTQDEWQQATEDVGDKFEALRTDAEEIVRPYRDKLAKLGKQLDEKLAPLREQLEDVEEEVREDLEQAADALEIDLPDRPEAEIDHPDESDWLFDAHRSYGEQLRIFKLHKEG